MSDQSNPTKPGGATSEFKMSTVVIILSAALAGLTTTFAMLKDSFPDVGWVGVVAGLLSMAYTASGYAKSRGTVKAADILASVSSPLVTPPTPLQPPTTPGQPPRP